MLDFSSVQGQNGWYYGYYTNGNFVNFVNYGSYQYADNSWYFNNACYGTITSTYFMPVHSTSCSTTTCGSVSPVLRWYNPINSYYKDIQIQVTISQGHSCGDGVTIQLTMNNNIVLQQSNPSGALNINTILLGYNISSIELLVSPIAGCDCDQTDARLIISKMGASSSATISRSALNSKSCSASKWAK